MSITAYKAFDESLRCRDFQYEVGKTYKHDGSVKVCSSGFHSCENPLDCLSYYGLTTSRFAEVEVLGDTVSHSEDSKIASAEIHIKAELRLPDFIQRSVDYLLSLVDEKEEGVQAASGYYAQLAASGDCAQLAASGDSAKLAASGKNSVIASASHNAKAKGEKGTWISLAEFGDEGKCVGFATGCIGEEGLKADTWYSAKNGKLVEES